MAAAEADGLGGHVDDIAGFMARLNALAIEIEALEAAELQILASLSAGDAPGARSSMMKTVGTELSQRLTELALEAAGAYAPPYQPHATRPGGPTPGFRPPSDQGHVGPDHSLTVASKYLNDRAASIYAGTNEIQRNIMAKAVLGL
jgi:alkylation response protein AidB-like acyl-CoA dehydrogenase